MTGRLAGKVGIITGAAGGIGSAAARAFGREGATVGLIDCPGPALDEVGRALGDSGVRLPADVTEEESVAAAFAIWGRQCDFVYVCAGTQMHADDGPIAEVSLATWQRTIAVNLTGAFLTVKHAIEPLRQASSGSLILCGSPTGMTFSGAGYTAYSASKAGMMALARGVAIDYAADGIRANIIVPGPTDTPLITSLVQDAARRQALIDGTPLGRIGTPQELTGIAVYLASDESRYATGASFVIDGGLTQR